jgi:hypothetical protein
MKMKNLYKIIPILLLLINCEAKPKDAIFQYTAESQATILKGLLLSSNFVDRNNGTITHTTTGLTWKKCSQGQTYEATTNSCNGGALNTKPYYYVDLEKVNATTFAYCSIPGNNCNDMSLDPKVQKTTTTFLNFSVISPLYNSCNDDTFSSGGWRVPTRLELEGLAQAGRALLVGVFPQTVESYYWTSTADIEYLAGENSFAVNFNRDGYGESRTQPKVNAYYVRCVK